jgi:hypothetical protein
MLRRQTTGINPAARCHTAGINPAARLTPPGSTRRLASHRRDQPGGSLVLLLL